MACENYCLYIKLQQGVEKQLWFSVLCVDIVGVSYKCSSHQALIFANIALTIFLHLHLLIFQNLQPRLRELEDSYKLY